VPVTHLTLREVELSTLVDCTLHFRPSEIWPEADIAALTDSNDVDDDGSLNLPVNCFLVRDEDGITLVDTGVGPGGGGPFAFPAGTLLSTLADLGVRTGEVDRVVLTHLHPDHVGGNVDPAGRPTFPNARYLVAREEWSYWVDDRWRASKWSFVGDIFDAHLQPLVSTGHLELVESAPHALSRTSTLVSLPGHTPGHSGVDVCSGGMKVRLIGDAMHHPIQCAHSDWRYVHDTAPDLAVATRLQILEDAAAPDHLLAGSHFPAPSILSADR
jgi:glyoxylase-like metal-dependent hydrolase (beta-lactamase superfamily II)